MQTESAYYKIKSYLTNSLANLYLLVLKIREMLVNKKAKYKADISRETVIRCEKYCYNPLLTNIALQVLYQALNLLYT